MYVVTEKISVEDKISFEDFIQMSNIAPKIIKKRYKKFY